MRSHNNKETIMSTDKNKPTHEIFAVQDRGKNRKSYWQKIGAAWANADGKGFSIKLDLLPLNGGDIVMREPKPQAEAESEAERVAA